MQAAIAFSSTSSSVIVVGREAGHRVRVAADVDEGDDARLGVRDDVRLQHADVRHADRAAVEHGRDAGAHADLVGVAAAHADAGRRGAVRDVGVHVDQAGRDVAVVALDLDDALRLGRRDVGLDGGDLAVGDGDVELAAEALAGVQDVYRP